MTEIEIDYMQVIESLGQDCPSRIEKTSDGNEMRCEQCPIQKLLIGRCTMPKSYDIAKTQLKIINKSEKIKEILA